MNLFRRPAIPLPLQFEAACAAASIHDYVKVPEMLAPYGYPQRKFDHERRLKKYLTFTPPQLLEYLRKHPEACEKLVADCEDKRFSPSPAISMHKEKYLVYVFEPEAVPMERDLQAFDTLAEAVTDYVLLSLHMPRLKTSGET